MSTTSPAPKSILRYDGAAGRNTAVVLKDNSILEVKRDGVSKKTQYASYADWIATLPGGAEAAIQVETAPVRSVTAPGVKRLPAGSAAPTTDVGWMLVATKTVHIIRPSLSLNDFCEMYKKDMEYYKNDIRWNTFHTSRYNQAKARVDAAGGSESEKANHRPLRFSGRPFWILSKDGSKPEPLYFGRIYHWNRVTSAHTQGELSFFYQGKQGTTFAEVGIPVDAETGWPNLWRIHNNQFKPLAKPIV